MATCLVALGSNAGNREALLGDALIEMEALGQVRSHSGLYQSRPVGGPPGQGEFLNGAAVVETAIAPLPLLGRLHQIEARHARHRGPRWAARTLDLDLLLYDEQVIQSAELTVPHPRMSFRRFVLEPAAEIAGPMRHPAIGWTIDRLLYHLDAAPDQVAILSPMEDARRGLAARLGERLGAREIAPPASGAAPPLWPPDWTTWMALDLGAASGPSPSARRGTVLAAAEYPVEGRPKLTVILDTVAPGPSSAVPDAAAGALSASRPSKTLPDWSALRLPHDRGPTLTLRTTEPAEVDQEVFAALQAVWSELCPPGLNA